jgi:hypothetical protein
MPAPHDWQPSRKRAEELFGGTSSVLPADFDFDVMTDVDSGSNSPKWDGGKGQCHLVHGVHDRKRLTR